MPSVDDKQVEISRWLTLNQTPSLGNAAFCQLLSKFGSPEGIFNAKLSQLREVVDDDIAQKVSKGVDAEAIYLGDVNIARFGAPATGDIVRAKEEIFTKDRFCA